MGGLTGDTGARAPRFQCREGDMHRPGVNILVESLTVAARGEILESLRAWGGPCDRRWVHAMYDLPNNDFVTTGHYSGESVNSAVRLSSSIWIATAACGTTEARGLIPTGLPLPKVAQVWYCNLLAGRDTSCRLQAPSSVTGVWFARSVEGPARLPCPVPGRHRRLIRARAQD